MMWNRSTAFCACLALLASGVLAAGTFAAGTVFADGPADDEDIEIEIKKRIAIACDDDDDCGHSMIFIGDDGEARHLEIAADAIAWAGDHGHHFAGHLGRLMGHHGGKGGFLGVMMSELTPELRSHFGVPEDAGVMVAKVVDDSPASRAGLQVGDIISAVDGEAMSSSSDLARAIRSREADETVDLEVWRDGRVQTVSAAVEARKGHGARAFRFHCGDDEDCDFDFHHDFDFDWDFDFDCGEGERCNLEIDCEDGDCNCTLNGEAADCSALHELRDRD